MERKKVYKYPIPGIPIVEAEKTPSSDEVLLGYELIHDFEGQTFVKPDPKHLNTCGWVSVALCFLCFWPATCVPCCLSCSYSRCQRPVFGTYLGPSWYLVKNVDIKSEKDLGTGSEKGLEKSVVLKKQE